jgi:TetR/AcrR family transcriptional repressor of nem operon
LTDRSKYATLVRVEDKTMARQKEFDRNRVLDKALDVFWCRGYEATSMQDLVANMGISRQSLYDTFGNKHALYLAALDRYAETEGPTFLAPLAQAQNEPVKAALGRVFQAVVDEAVAGGQQRGCFMVNAAVECLPHDQDTAMRVLNSVNGLETAFVGALERAQVNGELRAEQNVRAIARFLVNAVHGLRVLAKTTTDGRVLQDVIDVTLHVLD